MGPTQTAMLLKCRNNRVGRAALVWAVSVLFAVVPAISMALATPVGAFSHVFAHIHALEDQAHEHVTVHDHGDGSQHEHVDHDHGVTDDGSGQGLLHVHYDVACPSVLVPAEGGRPAILHRLSARLSIPAVAEPPDAGQQRLLRPPI